jgi:hypothetical protein
MLTRFEDIDWTHWTSHEHATLLFVRQADRVLLIRKQRGLGAGKINGPGGRLDEGESPLHCVIRYGLAPCDRPCCAGNPIHHTRRLRLM